MTSSVFASSGLPVTSSTDVTFIGSPFELSYTYTLYYQDYNYAYEVTSDSNVRLTLIGQTFYMFTDNVASTYTLNYTEPNGNGSVNRSFNSNQTITDGSTTLYYSSEAFGGQFFNGNSSNRTYPDGLVQYTGGTVTSSSSTIIEAWNSYIPPSIVTSTFTIPAGNVAYILAPSSASVTMSCTQANYSNYSSPYWNSGQTYSYIGALPSASTSFPLTGAINIPWNKGNSTSVTGQTRYAKYETTFASNQYLVIYNPLYNAGGNVYDDLGAPNGDIVVTVGRLQYIRVFPLQSGFSGNTITGFTSEGWSTSDYEDYYDGTIDSETGDVVFYDTDGNVSAPHIGGSTELPEPVSIDSFFQSIKKTLSDIVTELGTIFGFAYEAVVTLVGTASSFVSVIGGLYAWLPSPLSSVLISAITLAITIGVFKVFL